MISFKRKRPRGSAWPLFEVCSAAGLAFGLLPPSHSWAQVGIAVRPGEARSDIAASVQGVYDSNVSRSSSALAEARRLVQQDYIAEPSITVDLARPLGGQSVFLTGSAGYDFYARNRVFNRERIDLRGGAALQEAGCSATVAADFGRRLSQLEDLELLGVLENVETDQTYSLNANCPRAIGFSPTGSISETVTRNSLELQKSVDHQTYSGSIGLTYSALRLGQLQIMAQYDATDYGQGRSAAGAFASPGGFRAYSETIRYDRPVGSRLQATVQVGHMHLRPALPREQGFDGLTLKGALAMKIGSRLSATFNVEQGTSPANRIGVSFARNQSAQAALNYFIGTRLSVASGAFMQDHRYSGLNLDPSLIVRHERVDGVFASSQIKAGRRLSFLLDCRWEKQTANLVVFSYHDVRVSLTASTKF